MSKHFLLTAAATLMAASLSAQQVQFSADLDQPNNVISWNVSTSIGSVNVSPTSFRIGGTVEMKLDSASAPFSTGSLNGSLAFTDPDTLNGSIPNPIPFLPPLATFKIRDMEFHLSSSAFNIDASGNFSAMVTLTATTGTNTMGGLFGSGTEPIFGLGSDPTPVSGRVTQSGSTIQFHLDLNLSVNMDDPATGISTDITFNGPVDAYTTVGDANSMHLDLPMPSLAGNQMNFAYTNASANRTVYLAGSLVGLGTTPVAPLGVVLDLAAPLQAGVDQADANGAGLFQVNIPASLAGRSIWGQALQAGRTSNVAGSWVE
ncbi:MAG: hypothetical protein QF489_05675 [Planctomycetota bacterium]|jgi:hypothetical protein|nr:hypothetical protein [Planctomycetota bacterium]